MWDASEGCIPELLGSFTVSVGGQNATGTHWCHLSPTPSGQLHVDWDYTYDGAGDPVERSGGNLIMEVVKAKGLPMGEFDEAVTSFAQLEFGGHVRRTKVKKNTSDPFWNDVFDLKPMDPDDRMQFLVLNESDESEIGRCMLDVAFWGENKKGSTWMPLLLAGQEEGDEPLGELFVRYKFTVRKRRVEEKKKKDTEFIELGYEPKINGEVGLIPDTRVYVWYQLLESKPFRHQYAKALLSDPLKRERTKEKVGMGQSPWVDVPYESVDELVEMHWKCKTRHLLFNKIRSTASPRPYPYPSLSPTLDWILPLLTCTDSKSSSPNGRSGRGTPPHTPAPCASREAHQAWRRARYLLTCRWAALDVSHPQSTS